MCEKRMLRCRRSKVLFLLLSIWETIAPGFSQIKASRSAYLMKIIWHHYILCLLQSGFSWFILFFLRLLCLNQNYLFQVRLRIITQVNADLCYSFDFFNCLPQDFDFLGKMWHWRAEIGTAPGLGMRFLTDSHHCTHQGHCHQYQQCHTIQDKKHTERPNFT